MKNKIHFSIILMMLPFLTLAQDYAAFVDPMIGTGGAGHTFPGATVPYGMVQVSPDTRVDGSWEGCSGYHHSDTLLYGFSHTHLSGTGCPDYGDILLLPFAGSSLPPMKKAVRFSHSSETASPGYYAVNLPDQKIYVNLTAGLRSAFHRYVYNGNDAKNVLLDLFHRDRLLDGNIKVLSPTKLEGYRRSEAWAKDQLVFFCMEFDQPFKVILVPDSSAPQDPGKTRRLVLRFEGNTKAVQVKVGLSSVSEKNAWKNLEADITGWDFNTVRQQARAAWNKELGRIEVKGASADQQKVFYTALYHCMVVPNTYSDVNGQYRGRDGKVHKAVGYTHYTVFSLWDTFRAWHPLMTLIDRKRTLDYIKTFLAQFEQGGLLPVWELSSNETECMIGYHAIPVIVDAWMGGIRDFDGKLALKAMRKSAESRERFGLGAYIDGGRLSMDDEHESVSKTLEYAYDDWCIARFAASIGDSAVYKTYMARSQSWKNLFDVQSGFIRPVKNGGWLEPFDPYEVNNNFTEANAWHYTFFVPQDIPGLMSRLGGKEGFAKKLDALFSADSKTTGREQADISGLIGQYAHGNEPSHNMAYLYDYAGQPWKTQERVRQILDDFYKPVPDGLIGNEDCGQMSAWYVISSMGIYEVTPGSGYFAIGTPLFSQVNVHLENGKDLIFKADQMSPVKKYIHAVAINGQPLNVPFISREALLNGATVDFAMQSEPDTNWGIDPFTHPTVPPGDEIIRNPMILASSLTFKDSLSITVFSECDSVFYTTDGSAPTVNSSRYDLPFSITNSCTIRVIAFKNGMPGKMVQGSFNKLPHPDWTVILESEYSRQYSAGGPDGIINGVRGDENWRKGEWQGYQGQDFDVVIDMGKKLPVNKVSAGFLQDTRAWILMPKEVTFSASDDNVNFNDIITVKNTVPESDMKTQLKEFGAKVSSVSARYIKVHATNYGNLPSWHLGAGSPAYIFVDEITVE